MSIETQAGEVVVDVAAAVADALANTTTTTDSGSFFKNITLEKCGYAALGVAAIGGTYYAGRKLIKGVVGRRNAKKSAEAVAENLKKTVINPAAEQAAAAPVAPVAQADMAAA